MNCEKAHLFLSTEKNQAICLFCEERLCDVNIENYTCCSNMRLKREDYLVCINCQHVMMITN